MQIKQKDASARPKKEREWGVIALLLGIAALVRIVFWIESADNPFRDLLFLDSKVYYLLAKDFAATGFWTGEVFFRAPLFPHLLGITYKLFGADQTGIRVVHALFGVFTALFTYLTARNQFGHRIARIAGFAAAVYPTLYFFEMSIMPTTVEVFTCILTLYALSMFETTLKRRFLVVGGVALELAVLARPTVLLFAASLPVWLWYISKTRRIKEIFKSCCLVIVPMLVVIFPITARNYLIDRHLVWISSQGGGKLLYR